MQHALAFVRIPWQKIDREYLWLENSSTTLKTHRQFSSVKLDKKQQQSGSET